MINTYGASANPCTFCVDSKAITELPEDGECLQFDLDGNGTTLFIRETSVPDVSKQAKKKSKVPTEAVLETLSTSLTQSFPPEASEPQTPSKSDRSAAASDNDNDFTEDTHHKHMNHLYTKKWSGNTYFEEAIRRIQMKHYSHEVQVALRKRKLWTDFQRSIGREKKRDLIRNSGPEWFQEPSTKQICLAASLEGVLKADFEEGVTGRTRQWLLDLGVTTKFTPNQVRRCMRKSLLNPIDFLLELHSFVLKSQLHVKKKRGDLAKPFSGNERLLLTAVCVLHLPVLLTMLNYILPPEKPFSTDKHVQELLFGDLDDETIRYATPYMEPVPFRNLTHFKQWAFDKVFRALLPSLMSELFGSPQAVQSAEKLTLFEMKESLFRISNQERTSTKTSGNRRQDSKYSDFSLRTVSPSISWLLDHCIAKRPVTESMFPYYDNESETPRFFSRSLHRKSNVNQHNIVGHEQKLQSKQLQELLTTAHYEKDDRTNTLHSASFSAKSARSLKGNKHDLIKDVSGDESSNLDVLKPGEKPRISGDTSLFYDTTTSGRISPQGDTVGAESPSASGKTEQSKQTQKWSPDHLKSHPELLKVWDEISAVPKKNQLKHAIKILEGLGDPLARLPNVNKLPTVLRWAELRRGKNRILDKKTKDELLTRSRGMWKCVSAPCSAEGPKIKCSKRFERLLTWDKKKWLQTEVRKEMDQYYSRVKSEKVNNARSFFPSMLNQYDYGSKLNRNFREAFFTYLPAREADTFVYKPWQPKETRN